MKTKFMQAFEDSHEDLTGDDEVDTGNLMYEQEESSWVLRTEETQLAEAQLTQDILEKIENAATTEEAVCIAKEHLLNAIGYKPTLAIEDFKSSDECFRSPLNNAINVAQESIFDKLGGAIKSSVSNDVKIAEQVTKAASAIKSSGGNEKTFKSPGWASVFGESSTAEEVIATVRKYKAIGAGANFNNLTSGIASTLDKISNETKRNWFVATSGSSGEIQKLTTISEKMKRDIDRLSISSSKSGSNKSKSITALTAAQASTLSKEVLDLLKSDNLEKISQILKKEIKSGESMYNIVSSFRYQKETPEDVKAAKKSINAFRIVLQELKDFLLFKSKVCYSSLQYIKASTK